MVQPRLPSEDVSHFLSIPWCAALLAQPDVHTFVPTSRLPEDDARHSPSRDQLFSKTLRDADAVPHCIGFYKVPSPDASPNATPHSAPITAASQAADPAFLVRSCSLLFDLRPGVIGFAGSVHGGLIASLIDEAMGNLFLANHYAQGCEMEANRPLPPGTIDVDNARFLTANMTVRFQRPLPAPKVVVVTSSLDRIEGRKLFLAVTITDEHLVEFAKCEGMWMTVPRERM
ncbi:hypothetical protein SODALDRAFT_334778 [Sodiomyces alkalinus F11]|uniref:Thioesterase domain-containing protein n=1 Tax=Sodiomyces alkalinus (strain CBS 110278 / VKM F-3762 / F11) TaxID=1314773 RepID=A0A3N2PT05_SODAK|nr:hypothetical protein SODALDRAFT_334778 [Sodiomyces alkalinus F11]ROT37659.1 hypothetical protein SODALDRAFT_334778 [Sodiomyces alkalinus F11]